MRFSIIIPAYNCEKYISASIESVLNQAVDSREIIIINDGSTDRTENICISYSRKYSFIKLINKENSGVSDTRNIGLDNASGEYILFLDADDELADGALEIFERAIENENFPDIILANYCMKLNDKCRNPSNMCNAVIDNRDQHFAGNVLDFYRTRENKYGNLRTIWAKAYSKKLLESIRFDSRLKIGEDMLFFLECVFSAERIVSVSDTAYVYRIHENSVMQSKKWKTIHNNLAYYELVKESVERHQFQNDLFALWLEIYESEWYDLMDSDSSFIFKYRTLCKYRKNAYFQKYSRTTQNLSKVERIYLTSIRYHLTLLWMLLIHVKSKRNRKRFTA